MLINNLATVKDIPAALFISSYAEFLKKGGQIELPSWLNIVKTGIHRKNSPRDIDWFFLRLASLARKFYINKQKGIGSLKKNYGKKKKRGTKPAKKRLSGGKIIRFALQQLEKLKIIQKNDKEGRKITEKAQQDMDNRARKIYMTTFNIKP
nr:40S ribosomal protein S19 [Cryptomonas curvata]